MPPENTVTNACGYCGMHHADVCPRVRTIEYHPNGTVKRVDFHSPQPDVSSFLSADDLHELTRRRGR